MLNVNFAECDCSCVSDREWKLWASERSRLCTLLCMFWVLLIVIGPPGDLSHETAYFLVLADTEFCEKLQFSATDILARAPMKGAAKCDNRCELQNSVNQWPLERALRSWDMPESMSASVLIVPTFSCCFSIWWQRCCLLLLISSGMPS
mmetsp:Transcript_30015/g.56297  ORF Transcript_30015/g.56297 Transcript_30015/m.56297 type:complete len:149 (+) Transcript_30015:2151-2597(+)